MSRDRRVHEETPATRGRDLRGCTIVRTLHQAVICRLFPSKTADWGEGPGLRWGVTLAALHLAGRPLFAMAAVLESALEKLAGLRYRRPRSGSST